MPKVLIDIPDIPKNDHQRWVLTHGGIVLDGLTNGEVFIEMNPNVEVLSDTEDSVYVSIDRDIVSFSRRWWSRKWGE